MDVASLLNRERVRKMRLTNDATQYDWLTLVKYEGQVDCFQLRRKIILATEWIALLTFQYILVEKMMCSKS